MKMGRWTPQIIRFMDDAAEGTDYFSCLGEAVKDLMPQGGYLCDAGCGMGQLTFQLAQHARCIDAVDYSLNAVSLLANRVALGNHANVAVRYADFSALVSPVPYDSMVFCLSTSLEDAYAIAQQNGASQVIVVNKVHKRIELDRNTKAGSACGRELKPSIYDFEEACVRLEKKSIVFKAQEISLEFGQPFRSLQDAVLFFELYRRYNYPQGVRKKDVENLLQVRDCNKHPYYLPMKRHLAIFSLDLRG